MIRPAEPADLDALVALDRDCFGPEAWSPAAWADEFSRLGDSRTALLAVNTLSCPGTGNDVSQDTTRCPRLGGFVVLIDNGDVVDLARVGVTPGLRRTGVGRGLVLAALEKVAGRTVLLEVAEGNKAARKLYEGLGFVEISRRPRYYGGEDAVVMRWR